MATGDNHSKSKWERISDKLTYVTVNLGWIEDELMLFECFFRGRIQLAKLKLGIYEKLFAAAVWVRLLWFVWWSLFLVLELQRVAYNTPHVFPISLSMAVMWVLPGQHFSILDFWSIFVLVGQQRTSALYYFSFDIRPRKYGNIQYRKCGAIDTK